MSDAQLKLEIGKLATETAKLINKVNTKAIDNKTAVDAINALIGNFYPGTGRNNISEALDTISNEINARARVDDTGVFDDFPEMATGFVWSIERTKQKIAEAVNSSAQIDDSSTGTDKTWSASKIIQKLAEVTTTLLGGAPDSADTLKELADQITALAQADNGLVSTAASQTFTDAQKLQAQSNLGLSVSVNTDGDNEFIVAMKSEIDPTLWTEAHA